MVAHGIVVVCGGGGSGIPVVRDRFGSYHGVDAVVEKDFTAALLARDVGADALLLLTDAAGVWADWGTPGRKAGSGGFAGGKVAGGRILSSSTSRGPGRDLWH